MITGATGFAGSFLVEHYAALGWTVAGTFRDPPDDLAWLPAGVRLHHVDLTQKDPVDRLVDAVRPDVVQHLAAQSSVAISRQMPLETISGNVGAQLNLLEALRRWTPEATIVIVGSCDEYGDVSREDNPVDESQPLRPLNPYALSKVAQDLMGIEYARVFGLRVIRVRPFLQTGPRRSSQFVSGSFARQVAEIHAGQRPPVIEVGNLDLERDFSDVRDVARAYAMTAERGQAGEVYNIASGEAHSLREMLSLMMESLDVRAEIRPLQELVRSAEPELLVGDASKIRAATGWVPRIGFKQSVRDTVAYWQKRLQPAAALKGEG